MRRSFPFHLLWTWLRERAGTMQNKYLFGITGGSGSGKSTVSDMFRSLGFDVIDCDKAAHRAYETKQCREELVSEFGSGVLTEDGLADEEIREAVHIVHDEGMALMVHGNGAKNVLAAASAGVDSVEHGAYLNREALCAMKEAGTVWVPTLSTIGNLRGKGRFSEADVCSILNSALENVAAFAAMGGLLAPGTDAGAWAVPHSSTTEYDLLAGIDLQPGITKLMQKF